MSWGSSGAGRWGSSDCTCPPGCPAGPAIWHAGGTTSASRSQVGRKYADRSGRPCQVRTTDRTLLDASDRAGPRDGRAMTLLDLGGTCESGASAKAVSMVRGGAPFRSRKNLVSLVGHALPARSPAATAVVPGRPDGERILAFAERHAPALDLRGGERHAEQGAALLDRVLEISVAARGGV
jgi:hypothetical protein